MKEFETESQPLAKNTSFTNRSVAGLTVRDRLLGATGLVLWILLFTVGALVASEPYRKKLGGEAPLPWSMVIVYSLVVLASYTVTNVAILCCISSVLGGLYRGSTKGGDGYMETTIGIRVLPYLIQGLVIFLLLVSGLFLLGEEPFNNLGPNKYIRLAGTSSLLSFLAGYKPRIFYRWLERFDEVTSRSPKTK